MKNLFRNLYLIIIALLAAGIVLLTIFVSRGGFEEKNLRISVIISDSSADRWASFKEGLKLAAQDEGLDLKIVNTDRFESVEEELKLIDAEVSGGADALIIELSSSSGLKDYFEKLQTRVPVVLIENNMEGRNDMTRKPSIIGPNNLVLGETAAEEMAEFFGGSLEGVRLGIVTGSRTQLALNDRQDGAILRAKEKGAEIIWILNQTSGMETIADMLVSVEMPDAVIALNNRSLESAAEFFSTFSVNKPKVIGIGNSSKSIYYLDNGTVQSLIVPKEFDMGYEALKGAASGLNRGSKISGDRTTGFVIVHRNSIFDEENQNLLFPSER